MVGSRLDRHLRDPFHRAFGSRRSVASEGTPALDRRRHARPRDRPITRHPFSPARSGPRRLRPPRGGRPAGPLDRPARSRPAHEAARGGGRRARGGRREMPDDAQAALTRDPNGPPASSPAGRAASRRLRTAARRRRPSRRDGGGPTGSTSGRAIATSA